MQDQRKNSRRVYRRRFDAGKCTRCGQPMPDTDLRTKCAVCRRYGIVYDTYARHFRRDFT